MTCRKRAFHEGDYVTQRDPVTGRRKYPRRWLIHVLGCECGEGKDQYMCRVYEREGICRPDEIVFYHLDPESWVRIPKVEMQFEVLEQALGR